MDTQDNIERATWPLIDRRKPDAVYEEMHATLEKISERVAQAVALVPGTSRSGVTITMALLLGLKKSEAVDFSFMLSISFARLRTYIKASSKDKVSETTAAVIFGLSMHLIHAESLRN